MRLILVLFLFFISTLLNAQTVAEKPLKIRKPGWMFSVGYGANYTIPTLKNPFWYSTEGVGGPKMHLSSQSQFNVGRRVFKDYWLLLGYGRVRREYKLYDLDPYSTTNAGVNTTGVVRLVSGIEFSIGVMGRHHMSGPFYVQWELARAREFLAGAKRIEFTPTQTVQSFEYNSWFYSQRTRGTVKAAFQWQPKRRFAVGLEPSYSVYLRDLGKLKTPDKTNLHSLALSLKGYVFL